MTDRSVQILPLSRTRSAENPVRRQIKTRPAPSVLSPSQQWLARMLKKWYTSSLSNTATSVEHSEHCTGW